MTNKKNQTFRKFLRLSKTTTVILSFALVLSSCSKDEDDKDNDSPNTDSQTQAPGFTLESLENNDVSLSDFDNHVVVLFFFGNNCPSCKAVAPDVESMLVTPFESNANYTVLGLDQWNGNASSVQAFKNVTGVTFPLLLNAAGVASDYNTTYDRLVVINQAGNIVFKGSQSASSDLEAAKNEVMELLE